MVLFGTKGGEKKRGRGIFYCPRCGPDRPYVHKELVRQGHIYFIPLVELGSAGEFIECRRCGGRFKMNVLRTRAWALRLRHAVTKLYQR